MNPWLLVGGGALVLGTLGLLLLLYAFIWMAGTPEDDPRFPERSNWRH